jgi:glycyl-tRNA synthetase beta chain
VHQKYFSQDNAFWFVANQPADAPTIIKGNERVLRARLADALFFWHEDKKIGMQAFSEQLKNITFQEGLGTLADKQVRLKALAALLFADDPSLQQAASFCKADLASGMVGEFPELQGIMGGYYHPTTPAISEHYLPLGANSPLPASIAGQRLALLDKLDTLTGFFAIGKIPTSSEDPFALRRAALGIIRLLLALKTPNTLDILLQKSLHVWQLPNGRDCLPLLQDFIKQRLIIFWKPTYGDATKLIIATKMPYIPLHDLEKKVQDYQIFGTSSEGAALIAAYKRIVGVLKEKQPGDIQPALFTPLDAMIYKQWQSIANIATLPELLSFAAPLAATLQEFFEKTLVNEDSPASKNRKALLTAIWQRLDDAGLFFEGKTP